MDRYTNYMKKRMILGLLALVVLLLFGAGCFFAGERHGLQQMTVKRVSPEQLATAMQQDRFYSTYRENTLLVTGTITSVEKQGNNLVATFKTSASFKAQCDLGGNDQNLPTDREVTLITEGATARRLPNAVLLTDCTLP